MKHELLRWQGATPLTFCKTNENDDYFGHRRDSFKILSIWLHAHDHICEMSKEMHFLDTTVLCDKKIGYSTTTRFPKGFSSYAYIPSKPFIA